MNKKIFLLALIILLVIGCKNKLSDPLNEFKIGSSESNWKRTRENNLTNKSFVSGDAAGEFSSYLDLGKYKIPVKIKINQEGYLFGKLLNYSIIFSEVYDPDWTLKNYPNKIYEFQNFDTLRLVYKSFVKKYGEPFEVNSIFGIGARERIFWEIGNNSVADNSKEKQLKKNIPSEGTIASDDKFLSIWNLKDYSIEFYFGKSYYGPDSVRKIANADIMFTSNNYKLEMQKLKDSLITTFTAKDYVKCFMQDVEINKIDSYHDVYNREMIVSFDRIERGANEDPRSVESFKYNAIFMDEYNTVLKEIDGLNFNFYEPLIINKSYYYSWTGNRYGWSSKYISSRTEAKELENAYANGFKIKCNIEVKAVKLDDGTIIQ